MDLKRVLSSETVYIQESHSHFRQEAKDTPGDQCCQTFQSFTIWQSFDRAACARLEWASLFPFFSWCLLTFESKRLSSSSVKHLHLLKAFCVGTIKI